jgi:hypothetical protein
MTTETEVQEAFNAAQVLADAGHDAPEAWGRYYDLLAELHPDQALTPWERELLVADRCERKSADPRTETGTHSAMAAETDEGR